MQESEITSMLRARLREQVAAAQKLNDTIRATRGKDRHAARMKKRVLGATTRVLHAALALLRGRSYRALERSCHVKLDTYAVACWVEGGVSPSQATRARVKAWHDAPPPVVEGPVAPGVAA